MILWPLESTAYDSRREQRVHTICVVCITRQHSEVWTDRDKTVRQRQPMGHFSSWALSDGDFDRLWTRTSPLQTLSLTSWPSSIPLHGNRLSKDQVACVLQATPGREFVLCVVVSQSSIQWLSSWHFHDTSRPCHNRNKQDANNIKDV